MALFRVPDPAPQSCQGVFVLLFNLPAELPSPDPINVLNSLTLVATFGLIDLKLISSSATSGVPSSKVFSHKPDAVHSYVNWFGSM